MTFQLLLFRNQHHVGIPTEFKSKTTFYFQRCHSIFLFFCRAAPVTFKSNPDSLLSTPCLFNSKKQSKGEGMDDFDAKLMDMYTNIYTMRQDLERMKKPIGTKDNPARTCKDLFYGHPKFKGRRQGAETRLHTELPFIASQEII